MASFYFVVSDKDEQNPPHDSEELKRRLDEIKKLIPQPEKRQPDNNMKFAARVFNLFKDCGLITPENMEHLNDKDWCDKNIDLYQVVGDIPNSPLSGVVSEGDKPCSQMNPLGGVVRREDLPMCDKSNLRYYCPCDELKLQSDIEVVSDGFGGASKLAVVCEGVTYYISNDWFSQDKPRPTKWAFYKWLVMKAFEACKKFWDGETPINLQPEPVQPLPPKSDENNDWERQPSNIPLKEKVKIPIVDILRPPTVDKPDDLSKIIESLNGLHAKVDELTYTPDDLSKVIESLKILHSKVDNLTLELDELKKLWE